MHLHIGNDVMVEARRIVTILDLESAGTAGATEEFLSLARTEGRLADRATHGESSAAVVTDDGVFLSSIASTTLRKRLADPDWSTAD